MESFFLENIIHPSDVKRRLNTIGSLDIKVIKFLYIFRSMIISLLKSISIRFYNTNTQNSIIFGSI